MLTVFSPWTSLCFLGSVKLSQSHSAWSWSVTPDPRSSPLWRRPLICERGSPAGSGSRGLGSGRCSGQFVCLLMVRRARCCRGGEGLLVCVKVASGLRGLHWQGQGFALGGKVIGCLVLWRVTRALVVLYEGEDVWEGLQVRQTRGDGVQPETAPAVLYPYTSRSTARLHWQCQHILGVAAVPHQERALKTLSGELPEHHSLRGNPSTPAWKRRGFGFFDLALVNMAFLSVLV